MHIYNGNSKTCIDNIISSYNPNLSKVSVIELRLSDSSFK